MVNARLRSGFRRPLKESRANEDLSQRLVTALDATSVASEAYRSLRTNLLFSSLDSPPKVIMLTSPGPGEGKSTTCANLGVVLAQAGKRTLILDCDFRKPVMHKFFELRNLEGITSVLVGERGLQDVWKEPVEGLKVVTVGPIPRNPAEIVGTKRFSEFIADVRERFDYVLVDAAPIGLVSDPVIIAIRGDGVLLVLDAENTRKGAVRQAIRSLDAVGAHVLGTVMNNAQISKESYYGYAGYYHD